ncbi:hypothetical protein HD806DRAFT_371282 [Xylariaceae sp. AK1471]|nr:hypothetical protein HD806DRAFT_371282 [Xylariaceae sp. AK1471]
MAAPYEYSSCLSAEPHNDNIKNHFSHYFGCLEAWERSSFFDPTSPHWVDEVERHINSGHTPSVARTKADKKREKWQQDCTNELQRAASLLAALAADSEENHVLGRVTFSRDRWRASRQYQSNIGHTREWRAGKGLPNGVALQLPNTAGAYNPEDDLQVPIMEYKGGVPQDIHDPRVTGNFPYQTTTVKKLLQRDISDGPVVELLAWARSVPEQVIWFHIPMNNMRWVESAIASYYGEEPPSEYQMRHGDEGSRAARLLRQYFWRGQQYGDPIKPNSRFMRPFCECITPSRRSPPSATENIVLFAPFLHWETSRQVTLFARKINDILASNKRLRQLEASAQKAARKRHRTELNKATRSPLWPLPFRGPREKQRAEMPSQKTSPQKPFIYSSRSLGIFDGGHSRIQHPLGQYLLDAARLYESLRNYRDNALLQKYLFEDPPLQPRRTLDQGYYTTLSSTRPRDRNQVVYRATTPDLASCHRLDPFTGLWTCPEDELSSGECEKCHENIRKVSRVVMVDQLWMWVLDQKTIVTCFPKRYGIHRHEPSGVFETVQQRLAGGKPVDSVFDIAHTILDECSNTFFDRMKDLSGQPRVLDIFSEAIRNVSLEQTLESQRLWDWINRARRGNRRQRPQRDLQIPKWTMSAEGELEREIQDIVEELKIMISVNKTHLDVYNKFIRYASKVMDSKRRHLLGTKPLENETCQAQLAYKNFQLGATKLIPNIKDRVSYLESLLKTASDTANLVKDLSQLRQQQDSVVQALQSVRLSLDSIEQGRTVMVFTIVTIVFSPLSFLSSIFGMNNAEFGDNQWKIADQLKLILSISLGVIVLALVFASRRVRSAAIYTATGLRDLPFTLRRVTFSIAVVVVACVSWLARIRRRVFRQKF